MERNAGQQYAINVFGRGIAQDLMHDLPISQVRDTYIETERMAINHDLINAIRNVNGDATVGVIFSGRSAEYRLLGMHEMSGRLYSVWGVSAAGTIYIYRDTSLIGSNADYPGHYDNRYVYMDGNPDSGELAICDGPDGRVPIVLDVDHMYAETIIGGQTTYTSDYNSTLYEVNQDINLTQPIFRSLQDVGVGGGVKAGSYAYSYRLVSDNGDETGWSPPTPFIPVPENYGQGGQPAFVPGAKTYGEAASLNATKYGIHIAFRVVNTPGFDFVEVKRIPNNAGAPVDYTASPEYIRLPESISETAITVVNFTDVSSVNWAPLDASNTIQNSIIATARTVRFFDNRLVLGGITYESRIVDGSNLFNEFSDVTANGIAFKKDLGVKGYTDIYNQVYNKSQRLGEKYGYSMQIVDNSGYRSFAVPIESLSNFKFPERRDEFGTNESAYSDDKATAATVDSWNGLDTQECYEVYDQGSTAKSLGTNVKNIVITSTPNKEYGPMGPTRREDIDDSDMANVYCDTVDGVGGYLPEAFEHSILATGLKLAGINTANLPEWASGISILRSEPAGRVAAQGIATYALSEGSGVLNKSLNKIWFYSPELDQVIGDKPGLFDDIVANPSDYQIQLVSPVGWFPEYYSGIGATNSMIDFVTYATAYYASDNINPNDVDATTGRGDGYATFGRWRNQVSQGSGIDASLIFDITLASQANNSGDRDLVGRSKYFEFTLGSNLYASTSIATADASNSANAEAFHEPFYIVNIIKNGANVSNNNIDQFKEIGHHIQLRSVIGYGTGVLDQAIEITSERVDDFHWARGSGGVFVIPTTSDKYTYIWVNGQRWLNVTHWAGADITAITDQWSSGSSFTQTSSGGDACLPSYGIYEVEINNGVYSIKFPYQTTGAAAVPNPVDIIPNVGDIIEVRYDDNQPIDILLGDTVIGPASFIPIDSTERTTEAFDFAGVAFPFKNFTMESGVHYTPDRVSSGTETDRYSTGVAISMSYIRQWLVMFMCESSVNLPFVYKDFFPYKNYVMRPSAWSSKKDTETVGEFLDRNNIHEGYADDYPDEHLIWNYGGFHFPQGYNFDYNKQHRDIYTELPVGVTEILEYPKRIQWGSKRSAASISRGISKAFPATNIYDILLLKNASEINILYDQYSGKGNNLYAITDRGVVGLLTDKSLLRDGVADELGVILSDAGFIQGEIVLDPWVGCPDKRFRGRAEGTIKNAQGIQLPGLVFPGDNDIYLLTGNTVASIGTNFRNTLVSAVDSVSDSSILTSTFDPSRNEVWVKIGGTIYVYSFSINNWVAKVTGTDLVGMTHSKLYDNSRVVRVGVTNYRPINLSAASIYKSHDSPVFFSDMGNNNPNTSVTFAVTPAGMAQFEFTDMFIASDIRPDAIIVSTDPSFSDTFTVLTSDIKTVSNLYRAKLGRTIGSNTLIGNTLYVRVNFNYEADVDMAYVRTGYKKVTGS